MAPAGLPRATRARTARSKALPVCSWTVSSAGTPGFESCFTRLNGGQNRIAAANPAGYAPYMTVSTTAHVRLDDRGVAWIDDTNTKVVEVALDMIAHGWSPEEIHFQHPHLSLGQIHAALGYYYDHKSEMDAQIKGTAQQAEQLRAQAGDSPIRKRLREMGKLA